MTLPVVAYVTPGFDGEVHYLLSFSGPNSYSSYVGGVYGVIENSVHRNNYRFPDYHRLDITFVRTRMKKNRLRMWTLGVTNVYNKMNPSFYSLNLYSRSHQDRSKAYYTAITLFPIMPSISYKISL